MYQIAKVRRALSWQRLGNLRHAECREVINNSKSMQSGLWVGKIVQDILKAFTYALFETF